MMEEEEEGASYFENFYNNYEIYEDIILGSGVNGYVYLCRDLVTQEFGAVKQLKYSKNACKEAEIHYRLSASEHVVNILDIYKQECENGLIIFVIMEYMIGGDLYIRNKINKPSEKKCANMVYQICKGIEFMHLNNLAHRDLKPANILAVCESPDSLLKISDFGFAKECPPGELALRSLKCTRPYVAPEILRKEPYCNSCDIWSLGVIIYNLVSGGGLPFPQYGKYEKKMSEIQKKMILEGRYFLLGGKWAYVSNDVKDLIKKIFVTDPKHRPTIDQILQHSWIKNRENLSDEILGLKRPEKIDKS